METIIIQLKHLLQRTESYFTTTPESIVSANPFANKWSKKEILGHLIDSAIHNLVRFTEIQYLPKPYFHRSYQQDELVKINNYQSANTSGLLQLWLSLNQQIIRVMASQTTETLAFEIKLQDQNSINLKFLMTDYADHTEHHLNQILK